MDFSITTNDSKENPYLKNAHDTSASETDTVQIFRALRSHAYMTHTVSSLLFEFC